jgi:hypothetical protein
MHSRTKVRNEHMYQNPRFKLEQGPCMMHVATFKIYNYIMQQSLVKGLNLSNYPLQHKCPTKKGLVKIMHTGCNLEAKLHCNHKCHSTEDIKVYKLQKLDVIIVGFTYKK